MKKLATAAVATVLTLASFASPAMAAEPLVLREVDTRSENVRVVARIEGKTPKPNAFVVTENGKPVPGVKSTPLFESDARMLVALVIDHSATMHNSRRLANTQDAAKEFVAGLPKNAEVAVVGVASTAKIEAKFTLDRGDIGRSIDRLDRTGDRALLHGLQLAKSLIDERVAAAAPERLVTNVVVVGNGSDTASAISAERLTTSYASSSINLLGLGIRHPIKDSNPAQIAALTQSGIGTYFEVDHPSKIRELFVRASKSLANQHVVTFTSPALATAKREKKADVSLNLVVAVDGMEASAKVSDGTVVKYDDMRPKIVKEADSKPLVNDLVGFALAVLTAVCAAGLFAYALFQLFDRGTSLDTRLSAYDEGRARSAVDEYDEGALVESAIMKRAIAKTEQLAQQRGLLEKVEGLLERADLPLRAGETIFISFAVVGLLVLLGMSLGGPLVGIVALVLGMIAPVATLKTIAARRRKKFTSGLPDMLQLLAGSLRAGYSLLQGVDAVAEQVDDPMGKELRRALAEARLGRPVEEALGDIAVRTGSKDFEWAVMAISIQRDVGGNLSELLETVGETMVGRERLRREVSALTAEGRISAIVMGILPVALGVIMYFINPDYIMTLFTAPVGKIMLVASILLALAGFYWMKKTIEVDI